MARLTIAHARMETIRGGLKADASNVVDGIAVVVAEGAAVQLRR
jgi:hypothetical protein